MKIEHRLAKQFQKQFEDLLPKGTDTAKNKEGDYLHKTTQAMWLGFMLPMQNVFSKGLSPSNRYIIAGHDVNGFPVFSNKPRVHNVTSATLEISRLSESVPGHRFGLYQQMKTIKTEKSLDQVLFYEYTLHRLYIHFDWGAKFKRYHITDDFGNAVMPPVMHWYYEGEFMEFRRMQGLKIDHNKKD